MMCLLCGAIDKEGILSLFYSDESQRALFHNSEVWHRASAEAKWIKVRSNGECVVDGEVKRTVNIATTTDSDSNTKIVTREDNVLVFCESNGDGFIQCPDSSHVFIKSNISSQEWDLHDNAQENELDDLELNKDLMSVIGDVQQAWHQQGGDTVLRPCATGCTTRATV